MGGALVADKAIGGSKHGIGDGGMHIQGGNQGNTRLDFPDGREQIALRFAQPVHTHGTVEGETDCINLPCTLKGGEQLFFQRFIDLALPLPVGDCTGDEGRDDLIASLQQRGNHPADAVILDGAEHLGSPSDADILPTGKDGIERIGLVVHTTDYDAFHLVGSPYSIALCKSELHRQAPEEVSPTWGMR
ncbi:hypothetical protein SDC9_114596 [bioreactor metagenome]|uniref:Uncharacterized protein n=1 Tax=bioreactor metagenome TaxID=1076179 RepID=A0A645BR37_9ZZZZ